MEPVSRVSCSACYRRKTKCDRILSGCSSCKNSQIPCLYTPPKKEGANNPDARATRHKRRGPYKKEQSIREKELEHLNELLQAKCDGLERQVEDLKARKPASSPKDRNSERREFQDSGDARTESDAVQTTQAVGGVSIWPRIRPRSIYHPVMAEMTGLENGSHPRPLQIFELWDLFRSNIDPLIKVFHMPTMNEKVMRLKDSLSSLDSDTERLMFTIYHSALSSMTSEDVFAQFGATKGRLLALYQGLLDRTFLAITGEENPGFTTLQALVTHIVSL